MDKNPQVRSDQSTYRIMSNAPLLSSASVRQHVVFVLPAVAMLVFAPTSSEPFAIPKLLSVCGIAMAGLWSPRKATIAASAVAVSIVGLLSWSFPGWMLGAAGLRQGLLALITLGAVSTWARRCNTAEQGGEHLLISLMPATIIVALYAWVQALGIDPIVWSVQAAPVSFIGNSSSLGCLMVSIGSLALLSKLHTSKILLTVIFLAFSVCSISQSRLVLICTIVSISIAVVMLAISERSDIWQMALRVLAAAIGVTTGLSPIGNGTDVVSSGGPGFGLGFGEYSDDVRIEIWSGSIQIIKENPFTGTSPGGFSATFGDLISVNYPSLWELSDYGSVEIIVLDPHNLILQMAAFYGLPCAFGCIVMLSILLLRNLRNVFRTSRIALHAAAIPIVLLSLVNPIGIPESVLLAVLFGLLLAPAGSLAAVGLARSAPNAQSTPGCSASDPPSASCRGR